MQIKRITYYIIGLFLLFILALFTYFSLSDHQEIDHGKPLILVSIPPYQQMVEELSSDLFIVESLVPPGFDPHLYESKPKDIKKLTKAVIWFGIGEFFEEKLLSRLKEINPKLIYVNLAKSLQEMSSNPAVLIGHEHDHGEGHNHTFYDTHIWLSPSLDTLQSEAIKNTLSLLYPDLIHLFNENYQELAVKHEMLVSWISTLFKDRRPITFLTPHPAYQYFSREFDLKELTFEVEGKEPLPKDLTKFFEEHKNTKIDAIILDPIHSQKGAIAYANNRSIPVYHINPYAKDYILTLHTLAQDLAESKANGNSPSR